jgi:phage terminase large subunit-like protein
MERFFARRLRHGKAPFAGKPFLIEDWQREFLQPVYDDLLPNGLRRVREAGLGIAKKNGKTHLCAGLGCYHATADGRYRRNGKTWLWEPEYGAEVYNIAGSRDQAKILFQIAAGFVNRDPMLRAMCKVYRDAIEIPETESVWRVLASDAKLTHGYNPSVAIIDEIWVHRDPEQYEAFAGAGAAREQPLVIWITTAGFDQDSLAWRLYERGQRRRHARTFYFRWYEAPAGSARDDVAATRAANPSRWVTDAYLASELRRARELGNELQFDRFHRNNWTGSKEAAIPDPLWMANAGRPYIPEGSTVVIAVDAAPKHDSTGIAIVRRDDDGILHARVVIMHVDPETGYLDFGELEELLRDLCRRYDVERILVDRYAMVRSMTMLADEDLPIEEFPQSDLRMVPASMNLYELLMGERLRHGGGREMRIQVASAAKQVTERGWRLKKTKSGLIDGVVALAMACYIIEAPAEAEPQPSLFI